VYEMKSDGTFKSGPVSLGAPGAVGSLSLISAGDRPALFIGGGWCVVLFSAVFHGVQYMLCPSPKPVVMFATATTNFNL
jgi:hypothetical protein